MMLLGNGEFHGRKVVSPAVITKLQAGGSRDKFSKGPESAGLQAGGDCSYRAQWWVRHTKGREAFTAIGIHGQWIYVDRLRNVAIVKQSSQPVSKDEFLNHYDVLGFEAIIDHLSKKSGGK